MARWRGTGRDGDGHEMVQVEVDDAGRSKTFKNHLGVVSFESFFGWDFPPQRVCKTRPKPCFIFVDKKTGPHFDTATLEPWESKVFIEAGSGIHNWWVVTGCHGVYFPKNIGNLIIPIDELISFGGVAEPPTRNGWMCLSIKTMSGKPHPLNWGWLPFIAPIIRVIFLGDGGYEPLFGNHDLSMI